MVVSVPLHYDNMGGRRLFGGRGRGVSGESIHKAIKDWYGEGGFVEVMDLGDTSHFERGAFLRPDNLANTNKMQLFVFANDDAGQCVLCARLDNLGKGASGAAVQNLNLALGLDEGAGL